KGVMLAADPAFIGPDWLQSADNWLPDQTGVLAKRRGTSTYQTIPDAIRVDRMLRVIANDGTRYLYAVAHMSASNDQLWVSVNDGAFALVTNGTFGLGATARY